MAFACASAGQPAVACRGTTWTAPAALRDGRQRPYFVETPQVIHAGRRVLLVGAPTFRVVADGERADGPTMRTSAGSVLEWLAGIQLELDPNRAAFAVVGALPLPPGSSGVSEPRATSSGDTVAVVWGNEHNVPRGGRPPVETTLWDGKAWRSSTLLIPLERAVGWNSAQVSAAARLGRSAYVAASSLRKDSLYLLRGTSGGWSVRAVPFPRHSYSQLAVDGADTAQLLLAYVAPRDGTGGNALFVSRSYDGGSTWAAASRISPLDGGDVHHPRLASGGRETYVAWLEESSARPTLLRLATAQRGANVWSLASPHPLRVGETSVSAPAVVGSTPHFLIAENRGPAATLQHVRWTGGSWRSDSVASVSGSVVPRPVLTSLGDTALLATWSVVSGRGQVPATYYAFGRACAVAP